MKPRSLLHRLLALLTALAFLISSSLGAGMVGAAAAQTTPPRSTRVSASAFSPDGDPLLLVHGFSDTCEYAFNRKDLIPNTGLNAAPTVQYLMNHGWSSQALDEIGYYNPNITFTENLFDGLTATTNESTYCTHNLQQMSDQGAVQLCSSLLQVNPSGPSNAPGTLDDPIEHLGCLLSWYIYDTYREHPVDILAHSMGGLIVRDAIGEAGNNPLFPPTALNVHVVVTVGTPHGGVWGEYFNLAQQRYTNSPQELLDMYPTSDFMQLLTFPYMQDPQGIYGTYWALMAGTVPCGLTHFSDGLLGTGAVSCAIDAFSANDPFPEGDGVVQADSALDMPADFKILYGAGLYCTGTCPLRQGGTPFDSGDSTSYYSHESNTCVPTNLPLVAAFCLTQPFYLNDGTAGYTTAWICNVDCTHGSPEAGAGTDGMADMGVIVNGTPTSGQPALHSLAEIVALLTSQGAGLAWGHRIGVGQNSDGRLELFARGSNDTLAHNWQKSANGVGGWSGWVSLGGPSMTGEPAVGRNSDGRLEVFVRASDGTLWHIWQNVPPQTGWSGWAQLGPASFLATSDPAVGLNSNGELEVFARSIDGMVWTIQQSAPSSGWGTWFWLGGPVVGTGDPVVGQNSNGELEVFIREGSDIWTIQQDPNGLSGWGFWSDLIPPSGGAQLTGDPVVGRNSDGRLEVFAQAADGSVWHTWQQSPNGVGGWTSCCSLGGQIIGDPVVGQNTDGRLEIFALTPGGSLWHIWQKGANGVGGWSGWENLGEPTSGPLTSDPAVGQNSDGRLEVFVRGPDGTVWHVWQNVSAPGWSSWEWMGSL